MYSNQICYFWKQNKCKFGENCKFMHCYNKSVYENIEHINVVIKGKWADVRDDESFFD